MRDVVPAPKISPTVVEHGCVYVGNRSVPCFVYRSRVHNVEVEVVGTDRNLGAFNNVSISTLSNSAEVKDGVYTGVSFHMRRVQVETDDGGVVRGHPEYHLHDVGAAPPVWKPARTATAQHLANFSWGNAWRYADDIGTVLDGFVSFGDEPESFVYRELTENFHFMYLQAGATSLV